MEMEAMRNFPPPDEKLPAEAEVAPPAEAPPSSPAQKGAVTLPAGKTASGEGMESTEEEKDLEAGAISKLEPSTVVPSLFHRCSILLLELDGAVLFLVLMSGLYALLTPWLIWRAAGQPVTLIWTASLVAISYFFISTMCLSETMGSLGVFLRFSCCPLLAVAVAHVIGPISGAAMASLVTFYGAGVVGYSIGEYLQRIGIEKLADVLASRPLFEEQQKRRDECVSGLCFLHGIVSLLILARIVWMVLAPGGFYDDPLLVVEELSRDTLFLAWLWSIVVEVALSDEALVSFDTMFCKGIMCFFWSCMLCILIYIKWPAASMMIMWTIAMAVVGFVGYYLAVYARYQHIQSRNQSVSASSKLSQDGPSEVLDEPNKMLDEPDHKQDCCRSLVITIREDEPTHSILADESR